VELHAGEPSARPGLPAILAGRSSHGNGGEQLDGRGASLSPGSPWLIPASSKLGRGKVLARR
jgi:hypothetical protein